MDPVTLGILCPTFAIAVATARPNWEVSSLKEHAASYVFSPDSFSSLLSTQGVVQTEHTVYEACPDFVSSPRELVMSELYRYASLPDNWNNEGVASLSAGIVAEAKEFIGKLPQNLPLPSPMLSNEGVLGFYWDLSEGYVDVELDQLGLISVYARSRVPDCAEYYEDNLSWRDEPQRWIEKAFAMLASSSVSH